jgi:2-iminoacetate synthase ThiH
MISQILNHFFQKHANRSVPLPYQPENNDIPVQTPPTGFDALRTIAVSRS